MIGGSGDFDTTDARVHGPHAETARVSQAATAYAKYLELARVQTETIDLVRRARQDAAATRALVRADRARRALEAAERARLREAIREYVVRLKHRGDSLDDVLRRTSEMLGVLRKTGDIVDEEGVLELDVQRIVAEEYVAAA